MQEKIRVLIADDIEATRVNIGKLIAFNRDIELIGQARSAEEAIAMAKKLQPDIILMDINMPGMDGITATEIITHEVPHTSIIIISVQGEPEYLRRAMIAGAKNYLPKPFGPDELLQAIQTVHANEQKRRKVVAIEPRSKKQGKIITVFSTKGGVGKTTISANLAVALAQKTGGKVGIVDLDLQFGDVSLFLNILPHATIADLVHDIDHLDETLLDSYLTPYRIGIKVLSAPFRPEQADIIQGKHIAAILNVMRQSFDYVIVDTAPTFSETMLAALDIADQVLVVSVTDLPTIKNIKICLEVMDSLGYGPEKVKLILNRAHSESGLDIREVEESLRHSFSATLPSEGKIVVASVNRGLPFVESNPEAPVAQGIYKLARCLSDTWNPDDDQKHPGLMHKIKRMFG